MGAGFLEQYYVIIFNNILLIDILENHGHRSFRKGSCRAGWQFKDPGFWLIALGPILNLVWNRQANIPVPYQTWGLEVLPCYPGKRENFPFSWVMCSVPGGATQSYTTEMYHTWPYLRAKLGLPGLDMRLHQAAQTSTSYAAGRDPSSPWSTLGLKTGLGKISPYPEETSSPLLT